MAFPFYPVGLITAIAVLAGTLALFRALLLVMDRGAAELRGSIGPGLVRGVEAWAGARGGPAVPGSSVPPRPARPGDPGTLPAGVVLEEMTAPSGIDVEAVRPRR